MKTIITTLLLAGSMLAQDKTKQVPKEKDIAFRADTGSWKVGDEIIIFTDGGTELFRVTWHLKSSTLEVKGDGRSKTFTIKQIMDLLGATEKK